MVLLIEEVAEILGLSTFSVYRLVEQRRNGVGGFILPISKKGAKMRFLASDLEFYIQSRTSPVSASPVRQSKADAKRRQERTTAGLQRHGLNRSPAGEG